MHAERFFITALPHMILDNMDAFLASCGTISFCVVGVGKWTLFLGNCRQPVVRGFLRSADLRVRLSAGAFDAMLSGDLDTEQVSHPAELQLVGNRKLLARLGQIILQDAQRRQSTRNVAA